MESSRWDFLNDMAEHWSILKNKVVKGILVIFQDRPMFSHINGKLSTRPFETYDWIEVYIEKLSKYVLPLFILTPKLGENSLKQVFRFYCEMIGLESPA